MEDIYEYPTFGSKNKNVPPGIHIMNKNEKKCLRQLKAKTGLKECDLRKEKMYRKELSISQKQVGDKDDSDRLILKIQKDITKRLKLPNEHPMVILELKKMLEKYRQNWLWSYTSFQLRNQSDSNIILRLSVLNKKRKVKR